MRAQRAVVPLTFVTGPVRSGKSRFAQALASESSGEVTYVATAGSDPGDAEWARRIAHHAAGRPPHWRVVETAQPGSPDLATLLRAATQAQTLLVDSLGTWLAHRMSERFALGGEPAVLDAPALEAELGAVVEAAIAARACTIVVGEETGWGLVPPYPSGRVFRDVLGRAQQHLATRAQRAFLVVAGHALDLSLGRVVGDGTGSS